MNADIIIKAGKLSLSAVCLAAILTGCADNPNAVPPPSSHAQAPPILNHPLANHPPRLKPLSAVPPRAQASNQ